MSKIAVVHTYGCIQNENDSEKIRGLLAADGYEQGSDNADADLIIINTCAIRDNAETRVYSNLGALRTLKEQKPALLIGVCGCMPQQEHVSEYLKSRFPFVDIIFGTNTIDKLPELLENAVNSRQIAISDEGGIAEGLPQARNSAITANVSIMYGCNNFCTYCVVPYVRGRERSREWEDIVNEVEGLAAAGYKEITLLGQNVNSYAGGIDFPDLLGRVSEIEGIERIRFISSHPKDASDKLISALKNNPKVCKQLHLPFQSGSASVLADMNRRYTREDYLSLVEKIKAEIPDIALTSDVIVGFPTETQEDFEDTLDLIKKVGFDMLFTFIFSKRKNTPAYDMPMTLSKERVKKNFDRLVETQTEISNIKNQPYLNKIKAVLAEGPSKSNKSALTGRTEEGKIVNFAGGKELIGTVVPVRITKAGTWSLEGESLNNNTHLTPQR